MKKTKLNYPYFAHLLASFLLVCSPVLFFTACSEDDDGPVTEDIETPEDRGPIASDETVDNPAVVLGDIPSDMKEALNTRLTHFQNAVDEETDVLFVSSSTLSTYNKEIVTVYENGGIIVIVQPETAVVNDWFEQIGWEYNLDETKKELYAFSRDHQYILDEAYEETTINEHLDHFVSWVNKNLKPVLLSPPGSGETAIDKLIAAQTITHTYSYNLRIEEAHAIWSNPDVIWGDGDFTATYSIYPLYAFQGQPTTGDFYIVTAEYTAHNTNMCPKKPEDAPLHMWNSKHGGFICKLCGFFLTRFNVETNLLTDQNAAIGSFPTGYSPTPQTSQGSTSYSSGMSWNLGADVAVGTKNFSTIDGSVTLKGGVTFSNSQSRTISDVDIMNQSSGNMVKYEYKVNNLPTHVKGHISDPPLVSVTNATLFSSWIWRVSETTDGSNQAFYISTKPTLTYGSCHLYTSAADYEEHRLDVKVEDAKVQKTKLTPPNRIPTGLLSITNNNKGEYISDIVIKNEKGDVEYSSSGKGSIAEDNAFLRYIPTGKYSIEFKIGPNTHSTKTYVLCDEYLTIKRGETLSLNSAFDFEEKK